MAFTMEAGKKPKKEQLWFRGLGLFHKECHGGELEKMGYGVQEVEALVCRRCETRVQLTRQDRVKIKLTAIEGEERELSQGATVVQRGTGEEPP
jgi:hypothetical protein